MTTSNSLFSIVTLRHIHELLRPVRRSFRPLLALIIVVQVLQLATPYLFMEILDIFASFRKEDLNTLYMLIGATLGLSLVMSAVKTFRDRRIFGCLLTLERRLPILAQEKLMQLPLGFHERRDTGTMIVRVQRGTDRFTDLIANSLFEFLPTLLQCAATFVFLLVLNWRIALVFFPFVPLFFWITAWMNAKVRPLRLQRYEGYERAGGQMAESLMNVHTVQAFAQEGREIGDHSAIRDDIFTAESQEWRTIINFNFARDAIVTVGRIGVLLFSVHLVVQGDITIGALVLFLTVSEQAYYSLYRISRLFDRGAEWAEAVQRLTNLLHEEPEVSDNPNAAAIGEIQGGIVFDNVAFAYGAGKETLSGVSLTIPAGNTFAFVGQSGCGKTTMVKLLFRHYDPSQGCVNIDGRDVRDLTLASFRSQMAIVPQEVEIFNRRIRENIAYAKPDATMEEIVRAAQLANAHDFILSLPLGYETVVGERGLKLSGGQRQRIGIARALLPNPKILVFDEATSSLDSESEVLIQEALAKISAGRTTILIAHRLSTVRHADRIVVFSKGRIVEQGTHDQLLARHGAYHRLHELQTRSHRQRVAMTLPVLEH